MGNRATNRKSHIDKQPIGTLLEGKVRDYEQSSRGGAKSADEYVVRRYSVRKATSVPTLICDPGTNDTDLPSALCPEAASIRGGRTYSTRWAVHRPPYCTPESSSVKQGHDRPLDGKSRNGLTKMRHLMQSAVAQEVHLCHRRLLDAIDAA